MRFTKANLTEAARTRSGMSAIYATIIPTDAHITKLEMITNATCISLAWINVDLSENLFLEDHEVVSLID